MYAFRAASPACAATAHAHTAVERVAVCGVSWKHTDTTHYLTHAHTAVERVEACGVADQGPGPLGRTDTGPMTGSFSSILVANKPYTRTHSLYRHSHSHTLLYRYTQVR